MCYLSERGGISTMGSCALSVSFFCVFVNVLSSDLTNTSDSSLNERLSCLCFVYLILGSYNSADGQLLFSLEYECMNVWVCRCCLLYRVFWLFSFVYIPLACGRNLSQCGTVRSVGHWLEVYFFLIIRLFVSCLLAQPSCPLIKGSQLVVPTVR